MIKSSAEKFVWTRHAQDKLRYYRLSESRIKRIIRHPARVEEGILEGAVACMQPASAFATAGKPPKIYSEIWVMYVLVKDVASRPYRSLGDETKKIKIITAWRYPGKSSARDSIPAEILREIKGLL